MSQLNLQEIGIEADNNQTNDRPINFMKLKKFPAWIQTKDLCVPGVVVSNQMVAYAEKLELIINQAIKSFNDSFKLVK